MSKTKPEPTAYPVPRASAAAIELMACISRFEFALKEAGYIIGAEGGTAHPGWTMFAPVAAAAGRFEALSENPETRLLIDAPPRKQLRVGDGLTWSPPIAVGNMQQLTEAIRQVRNNLFHGGKAGGNRRDDHLCRAATAALLALLDDDDRVREAYLGHY